MNEFEKILKLYKNNIPMYETFFNEFNLEVKKNDTLKQYIIKFFYMEKNRLESLHDICNKYSPSLRRSMYDIKSNLLINDIIEFILKIKEILPYSEDTILFL